MMNATPKTVTAIATYSVTWQRILGVPFRRYITIQIIDPKEEKSIGWTQALRKKDIEYMVLDYMACMYEKNYNDYRVIIEWN